MCTHILSLSGIHLSDHLSEREMTFLLVSRGTRCVHHDFGCHQDAYQGIHISVKHHYGVEMK
jgi:hypothetical protein